MSIALVETGAEIEKTGLKPVMLCPAIDVRALLVSLRLWLLSCEI